MKLKKIAKKKTNLLRFFVLTYLDEYKSHRNKILKLVDRVFKSEI